MTISHEIEYSDDLIYHYDGNRINFFVGVNGDLRMMISYGGKTTAYTLVEGQWIKIL